MTRSFRQTDANFGTLNIIPQGAVFMVRCLECGVMREVERLFLEDIAGHAAELKAIEKRLKCMCGKKAAKLMAGYYATAW